MKTREEVFNQMPYLDRRGDYFNLNKNHILEAMEEYAQIKIKEYEDAILEYETQNNTFRNRLTEIQDYCYRKDGVYSEIWGMIEPLWHES